jgi:hypothetical protein
MEQASVRMAEIQLLFDEQQCGGCRFYIHLTGGFRSDWGVCTDKQYVMLDGLK